MQPAGLVAVLRDSGSSESVLASGLVGMTGYVLSAQDSQGNCCRAEHGHSKNWAG